MKLGNLDLEFTDTLLLKEPKYMTREEGEEEITRINAEISALSTTAKPYREWLTRLNSRIVALNKQRHTIQTHFENPGVKKVPSGTSGLDVPKILTREQFKEYLDKLDPTVLAILQAQMGI